MPDTKKPALSTFHPTRSGALDSVRELSEMAGRLATALHGAHNILAHGEGSYTWKAETAREFLAEALKREEK